MPIKVSRHNGNKDDATRLINYKFIIDITLYYLPKMEKKHY